MRARPSSSRWNIRFQVGAHETSTTASGSVKVHRATANAIAVVRIATEGTHAGLTAPASDTSTGAANAADLNFASSLAEQYGGAGIRVNTVSPGMVRTGMTAAVYADATVAAERDALVPLGRVATPEDIADVIVFLLGPDARYVSGHDLVVDGGVLNGPMD